MHGMNRSEDQRLNIDPKLLDLPGGRRIARLRTADALEQLDRAPKGWRHARWRSWNRSAERQRSGRLPISDRSPRPPLKRPVARLGGGLPAERSWPWRRVFCSRLGWARFSADFPGGLRFPVPPWRMSWPSVRRFYNQHAGFVETTVCFGREEHPAQRRQLAHPFPDSRRGRRLRWPCPMVPGRAVNRSESPSRNRTGWMRPGWRPRRTPCRPKFARCSSGPGARCGSPANCCPAQWKTAAAWSSPSTRLRSATWAIMASNSCRERRPWPRAVRERPPWRSGPKGIEITRSFRK